MAAPAPPKFTLPPPKGKKAAGEQAAFRAYINAHPSMKKYANAIFRAAQDNGIDSVYYASLLWKESFGEAARRGVPVETIRAPGGHGVGIAQINPSAHPGISNAQMTNAAFAINWGAQYLKQGLKKYGTYDAAYRQHYNHGYTGPVFNDLPKGYISTNTAKSAQDVAQRSVDVGAAKQALTDPYVTIKNGKLVKTDAGHAVKVFGEPLRRSQFLSTWQNLNDIYLSYTGKPVSLRQAQAVMAQGLSRYQLVNRLSNGPNFQNSQVWKQNAPGYEGVWKKLYGDNTTPDPEAVRYAIINNLGGDGFANELRKRPDYETSSEFKTQESSMAGVYTKIFGVPDSAGAQVIKTAARQGQTPDMFASYLRAAPEYKMSSEFKSRAVGLAQQLGFLTGQTPTLNEALVGGGPVGSQMNPDPNARPAGVLG